MTADFRTTPDDEQRTDLSDAFGQPATVSLRGLLPPRPRRGSDQDAPVVSLAPRAPAPEDAPEDEAPGNTEAPGEAPGNPAAPEDTEGPRAGAPADAPPARRAVRRTTSASRAGTADRPWGSVRKPSQEHVELLVLVALRRGPADGRELAERLRADSGGGLTAPPTTVQRTLHHLARHGLVEVGADTERRRYRLTELGMRIARARVRAWRSLRRAVDAVLKAADES